MKSSKTKRILAIICVILLVGLFVTPFVLSMVAPKSKLFNASIVCTFLIPVVLYAFSLLLKAMKPQKSPLIDAIVFDVGNVLVDFDWKGHMEDLGFSPETIDYLSIHVMQNPLWNEFDRGVRPHDEIEAEFCRTNPGYEEQIHAFISTEYKTIIPRGYAIPWIQDLKRKGYKLYILSNWGKPEFNKLKDSILCFREYMDGCIWSYQVHCIKPEREIYQKLINTYHLDPSRSVFLDDRQENLDGAKALGFNTVLALSHDDAVKSLQALGVK